MKSHKTLNTARPNLESLEDRTVLSLTSATLNAGTLLLASNNNPSDVQVRQSYSNLIVTDSTNGFNRVFNLASVNRVQFVGGNANDRFVNYVRYLPIQAWGNGGNDYLEGYDGNDDLIGGDGNDTLVGYGGNDRLWGQAGNDILRGMNGNDQLMGGDGNDQLFGGAGIDSLWGGDGNDWLEAGSASEFANGGTGTDWNAHIWAVAGATADDVIQRGAPTCSFLAALSSAAMRGTNLASRIRYLGNFQYGVMLFTGTAWREFNVTFDGSTTWTDPGTRSEGESWTILHQRAYIQMVGGDGSSWPDRALTALTGRATTSIRRALTASDFFSMQSTLALGRNVVTATHAGSAFNSAGGLLVSNHAYTVVSVEAITIPMPFGTSIRLPGFVTIRNPWASDGGTTLSGANNGYIRLTWAQFVASMQGIWLN